MVNVEKGRNFALAKRERPHGRHRFCGKEDIDKTATDKTSQQDKTSETREYKTFPSIPGPMTVPPLDQGHRGPGRLKMEIYSNIYNNEEFDPGSG